MIEQNPESSSLRFKEHFSGQEIRPEIDRDKECVEGDVICQRWSGKSGKKYQYFIVERIEPGNPTTAYVRHIKPALWKSILLAGLLIIAWFGISEILDYLLPF
jgi:hypothetical protein